MKFALVGALVFLGCADPAPRDLRSLVQQGDLYLDRESMRPYAGPVYRFFGGDSMRVEFNGTLKDGLLHGSYEDHRPTAVEENSGIYETGTYLHGLKEGPFELHYPSHQLRGRGTYVRGRENGPYESFHENGQLRSRATYLDGRLEGTLESFYENGQLSERSTYRNGQWEGLFESYFPNGQVRAKGSYAPGLDMFGEGRQVPTETGLWEYYLQDGRLLEKGSYYLGARCGVWLSPNSRTALVDQVTHPPCPERGG